MKPGSAGPGVLGIYPVIYDEKGNVVEAGSGRAGNMCIRNPWPGIFETIWGQPERFVQIYYEKYCRNKESKDWQDWPYFAGDGDVLAADGYFRIRGRVDDVINVAGHRLGTKEIESACLTVEEIAEAAAVPLLDELRGRVVEVYVALKPGFNASKDIEEKVARAIETQIGKIAKPKNIWIVADMPKTRSGKIMRRVLGASSKDPTHDLARAGLGHIRDDPDILRFRNLPDLSLNRQGHLILNGLTRVEPRLQCNVHLNYPAAKLVYQRHRGCLGNLFDGEARRLNLFRSYSGPGHIDHIVAPAKDPEIACACRKATVTTE